VTIEEVMTPQVITVHPETSVQEAARLMSTNHISGLPVIDASGRVVGMISDGDVILRQRRPKIRPWWRDHRKIVGQTVADVMTQPALVISPAFSIETAAAIMDNRQIRRLPVVRDGRLVGIVSRADLIKALAGAAKPPALESLVPEAKPHEDAGGSRPSAV
jgi:CBS domain-containing protein